MSDRFRNHRGAHRPLRSRRSRLGGLLRSTRVRALLSLGIVLGIGSMGTFAYFTSNVSVTGSSFTAGTLGIQVNNTDTSYATTTLGMTNMSPGATSAQVLVVKNSGNVPAKYTLSGGLAGTDAATYSSNAALKLQILVDGTVSGSGSTATCAGGTSVYSGNLTSTTTTSLLARRPTSALQPAGTESLCFQVTFDAAVPSTMQGKTASATFTVAGTTDIS